MATGTLQQSGDNTAQLEQVISTLGGSPFAGNIGELLKQVNAALAAYQPPGAGAGALALQPAGTVAATHDRASTAFANYTTVASGTLNMTAIYIPVNTVINNINCITGSTASVGVTHNWAVLADKNLKVLGVSADNTSADLALNTVESYALTTPVTTAYSGLYYVGFVIATGGGGATQPTMQGQTDAASTVMNVAPKICGTSNTGATTPPATGATLTAITSTASSIYFYLT